MIKKKLFIFIILFSLLSISVLALDDFTDNYNNDNFISSNNGVIVNTTLGQLELNYSSGSGVFQMTTTDFYEDGEDFPTGWTTSTSGGATIGKSNTEVFNGSWSIRMYSPQLTSRAYAYDTFTENTGDWDSQFWLFVDSAVTPDDCQVINWNDDGVGAIAVCRVDDNAGQLEFTNQNSSGRFKISDMDYDKWYEVVARFDDSENTIQYYLNGTDYGNFTVLDGSRELDKMFIGDTSTAGQKAEYFMDDIRVGHGSFSEGYNTEGFVISTDLLLSISGNPEVVLIDGTRFDNTNFTIEFSSDGSSFDNVTALINGTTAIYVNDYGLTSSFWYRINMTTSDSDITPYVDYLTLITDASGVNYIYLESKPIFPIWLIAILLLILTALVVVGLSR